MARDWENTFTAWTKPSSDTEAAKCGNAERMIKEAIDGFDGLKGISIDVFAQGSYKNNTNVRNNSDVDICVCVRDTVFSDFTFSEGLGRADVGLVDATLKYADFKKMVGSALVGKFGKDSVTRGKKAFDVHENTYRVDADVVACFQHRRYLPNKTYLTGTEFVSDDGKRIVNWPHQHYSNGVDKNKQTGNQYKYITRVLKRLCIEMAENDVAAAKQIPSFLIECLAWNTPNDCFAKSTYYDDVRSVLDALYKSTQDDATCGEWGEVSEMKYLFRKQQPWTREQANGFILAAWNHVGFK